MSVHRFLIKGGICLFTYSLSFFTQGILKISRKPRTPKLWMLSRSPIITLSNTAKPRLWRLCTLPNIARPNCWRLLSPRLQFLLQSLLHLLPQLLLQLLDQLHFLLVSHTLKTDATEDTTERPLIFITSTTYILNQKDHLWTRLTHQRLCMCCKNRPALLIYPKCAISVCGSCQLAHASSCHTSGHCHNCGGVATKICPCRQTSYCR